MTLDPDPKAGPLGPLQESDAESTGQIEQVRHDLKRLKVQLAEREEERDRLQQQLVRILESRRYRHAERMAKVYRGILGPGYALSLVRQKIRRATPRRILWQVARRGLHRMPAPLRDRIRLVYHRYLRRSHVAPPVVATAENDAGEFHVIPAPHIKITPQWPDNRLCIVIHQFFNQIGEDMFFGGAERYLIELARLAKDLGFEPEVYQSGNGHWVRHYNDLRVIGLDTGGDKSLTNEVFHAQVPAGALTIYLAFSLASPLYHARSIGISHGIYWDHENHLGTGIARECTFSEILGAMDHVLAMVSVDTSTMNWVRGTRCDLVRKFRYIPNFVDTDEFRPGPRNTDPDRVIVLYPRRLYGARGFWLVEEILPNLLDRFPSAVFRFVGKAEAREEERVRSLVRQYPGTVDWYSLPPERMSEAYQGVDIALIPTVHSEGTSLSCLEAQASGNAVIATNVGGLSDLVLHEHNGLLIEPTAEDLHHALVRLISDQTLRERLGRQAHAVAQTFSLKRWRQQWAAVLAPYLPANDLDLNPERVTAADSRCGALVGSSQGRADR
jgi:glycosyltransferase involved in cell wall biosynthesis